MTAVQPLDARRARHADWAAAVAAVCFGASVVATRFVVAETQPVSLAFLRYFIGVVCLLPVALGVIRRTSVARRDRFAIAALGAMFFGIFPWTFSAALTHAPSSRVAIILATMPLVTLLVSRLRGYDHITAPKLVGQLLAFGGLWLALHPPGRTAIAAPDAWKGDLLAGLTALIGASFNVFSRPYLQRYPSLLVTALAMIAGVLFLAPLAALQGVFSHLPTFTPLGWAALVFLGTLGGAFSFGLWNWALERSTPSRVAVFITLNPITAVLLGALLLHEPITSRFVVGLAAILGGIVLASWRPRSTGPATTAAATASATD